jgi:hypothetical protein
MTTKPKRPPSVWISQIILVFYSILTTFVFATALTGLSSMNFTGQAIMVVVFSVLVSGVIVGILVAAFAGLGKRRPWARWLSVGILIVIILSAIVRVFTSGGEESGAYRSGEMFGSAVMILVFGLLAFRLATGDAANDFFNPPDDLDELASPPPPPTFAQ